jgi:hypothetical protein
MQNNLWTYGDFPAGNFASWNSTEKVGNCQLQMCAYYLFYILASTLYKFIYIAYRLLHWLKWIHNTVYTWLHWLVHSDIDNCEKRGGSTWYPDDSLMGVLSHIIAHYVYQSHCSWCKMSSDIESIDLSWTQTQLSEKLRRGLLPKLFLST